MNPQLMEIMDLADRLSFLIENYQRMKPLPPMEVGDAVILCLSTNNNIKVRSIIGTMNGIQILELAHTMTQLSQRQIERMLSTIKVTHTTETFSNEPQQ